MSSITTSMELHDAMVAAATPIPAATGVCGRGGGGGGGLFTAAQWVELQRQALIYNHMAASAPIPSYLLFSIVSNAPAAPSYCYSAPQLLPDYQAAARMSMLLQCMQQAVARRRCRRTDGKKWRCARDAESDQKYCQRHLHRAATRRSKPSAAAAAAAAAPLDQNGDHSAPVAPKSSSKASGALLDFTGGVAGLPEQRENRLSLDYDTIAEQYHQLYCSSGAVNKKQAMDDGASSSWVGGIGGPLGEVLGYAAD